MKGTVKFFNAMKGFGFIAGEDGKEYFVHKTALNEGVSINDEDAVTFDVVEGDKGPKASNVSRGSSEAAPAEEVAEEAAPAEEEASEEVAPKEEASEEAAPAEEKTSEEAAPEKKASEEETSTE